MYLSFEIFSPCFLFLWFSKSRVKYRLSLNDHHQTTTWLYIFFCFKNGTQRVPLPSFAPTFWDLLHQEIVQRLVVYFYFWPIIKELFSWYTTWSKGNWTNKYNKEELKFYRLKNGIKFWLSKSVSTHQDMISYTFRAMIEFWVFWYSYLWKSFESELLSLNFRSRLLFVNSFAGWRYIWSS